MEFERRRRSFRLDIAPLIDIVLNLLIFFMLTSNLIDTPAINVNLPDSKTAESQNSKYETVHLSSNGEIYFMNKRLDLKNLQEAIHSLPSKKDKPFIQIMADKEADVGSLIGVIDEVRLAGVKNFSVVTERKKLQ